MDQENLDDFRKHHKLAADIARFIGKEIGIAFESKERVVRYRCDNYYIQRSTLSLNDYYSQGIMEYRLTGGWSITRLGYKLLVNPEDEWDIKILGWKMDDDCLKMVEDKSKKMPKGYKPLVDFKDNYIIDGVLIWGFNLGDKMKNPNQTYERDKRLEQQKRVSSQKKRDLITRSLQTGAEASAAVADAAKARTHRK